MSDTASKMQLMQDPSSCHVMNMSKISMLTIVSKRSVLNRLTSIKLVVGILAVALCVQCHASEKRPFYKRLFRSHKDTNVEKFNAIKDKKKGIFGFMFDMKSSVFRLCLFLTFLTLIAVFVPGKAEGNFFCGGDEAVGGSSLFMRLAVVIPSLVFIGIATTISLRRYSKIEQYEDVTAYNSWVQGNDGSESLCKRHSTTTSMAVWFAIILLMGLGALVVGLSEDASALLPNDTPFMQTPMFLITMISLLTVGSVGLGTSIGMLVKYKTAMKTSGAVPPADANGGITRNDTTYNGNVKWQSNARRLAHLVEAIEAQY